MLKHLGRALYALTIVIGGVVLTGDLELSWSWVAYIVILAFGAALSNVLESRKTFS